MPEDLQLMTPAQVSTLLGITEKTLAEWRWRGTGPQFTKLGGAHRSAPVRYRASVIRAWLDAQPVGGAQEVTR